MKSQRLEKSKGIQTMNNQDTNQEIKRIFIINGSGGSGKDTFVSLIQQNCNQPVYNFSSVDKVKEVAKSIGWDGSKTERDRKFLSDLKLLCTNYNDMPLNSMIEKVEEFMLDSDAVMLFLHIREPNEIERAKNIFNAKTILIKRDTVKQITSNDADGNVFNYNYDIVINNDKGIKELEIKALQFIENIF